MSFASQYFHRKDVMFVLILYVKLAEILLEWSENDQHTPASSCSDSAKSERRWRPDIEGRVSVYKDI